MDFYNFYRGLEFEAYTYLGAHMQRDGSTVFRTFAPAASKVSLIAEWNGWEEQPMGKVYDGNFWACCVAGPDEGPAEAGESDTADQRGPVHHMPTAPVAGQMYKYRIYDKEGAFVEHADPYAFAAEKRPGEASRLYDPAAGFVFSDASYLRQHGLDGVARPLAPRVGAAAVPPERAADGAPMNIYEVQAGSWRVPEPGNLELHYTYRELADMLVPYLKEMSFTHLELMPITEYPADESWGYQTTGFFAPTARYGTPDDLKYLVNACHEAGVGVILDFVAVHFAANDFGLRAYDGTPLYEYPNADVGYSEWGTCNFMHSRGEVRSFLQSSVWYWIHEFHFDGVRIDAVSNLIYWQGNAARGENKSTIEFLRTMNTGLKERCPGALLIAEDSSSYPGVTKSVVEGGLGFDYKWDLGWMNDTLSYLKGPAYGRKNDYHRLTFSIYYYYNERYLLPLSHDEVVHGKATNVQKMNGAGKAGKFAQARLLYAYQFAHPGKKLNFMGNELGGPYEYSEKKEIDWWVVRDRPENAAFFAFWRELNEFYAAHPALWAADYEREGFEWTDCGNEGKNAVYSFVRRGQGERLLAVFNFDDSWVVGYQVKLPEAEVGASPAKAEVSAGAVAKGPRGSLSKATKLLDSSWERFGGVTPEPVVPQSYQLEEDAVTLNLRPFSAVFLLLE